MENEIKDLAAKLNVTPAEAKSFLVCLSVWTSKGFSVSEAIEKHAATTVTVFEKIAKANKKQKQALVTSMFFPA